MNKFLLLITTCFLISCQKENTFNLNAKSINNIVILLDKNPNNSATFAARELQFHFNKSLGVKLPIIKGELPKDKTPICIGESNFTRNLGLNTTTFEDQEYVIKIHKSYIILAGKDESEESESENLGNDTNFKKEKKAALFNYGKANLEPGNEELTMPTMYELQGSCYATYSFLEQFIGIRWYGPHPNNIVIPKHTALILSPMSQKRSLAIKYRGGTGFGTTMNKDLFFNPTPEMYQLYDRRMRRGGEKWGSNHSFISFMDRYLTKNKEESVLHEAYRPEFFAVGQDKGERQLCYTNKELIAQVAQDACDFFDGNAPKGKQVAIGDYFALVPHDNANWCKCENCQILINKDINYKKENHFSSGTASHYLFNFINEVAKLVKKKHPDKKIAALAYWLYAYLPKDIKLENNISVAPCLQPRNYYASKIKENDLMFYKQWIEESKESNRPIYLWNYYCFPTENADVGGYHAFPGFSAHVLDKQIKMYAKDGVRGVFLCGVGEQVDYYITMKLYDNPDQDIDALLNEFFSSYFGDAGSVMKQFYTTIEKRFNDPNSYSEEVRTKESQFHQDEEKAWKYLGTAEVMAKLEKLIQSASEQAKTDIEKTRVASWKIGIWDYMKEGKDQYIAKNN
jgi:hypothetical protein